MPRLEHNVDKTEFALDYIIRGPASDGKFLSPIDYVQFGVGIELLGGLNVNSLSPGCSAEKSGNVQIGDEIVAVDGSEGLTVPQAKQMMLGRCVARVLHTPACGSAVDIFAFLRWLSRTFCLSFRG
jgi:hypothetical protein